MRYFLYSEFDQKNVPGSGESHMDRHFLSCLDTLRHKCDFPFIVNSGYRSPEYNNQVSSTGFTGPHTTGKASDTAVAGSKAYTLLKHAMEMDCFTGIGIGKSFIHLDIIQRNYKIIWSY